MSSFVFNSSENKSYRKPFTGQQVKSMEGIQEMLISELNLSISKINDNAPSAYFNKTFDDSSFLLAGLLGQLMCNKDDWEPDRWFDDSLLTKVELILLD